MEKHYYINVINVDQAISSLKAMEIDSQPKGSSIQFKIDEALKTKVIQQLNKEKVIIYDMDEI